MNGPSLNEQHIADAARFAAEQLADTGVARVRLSPGDFTEYPIMVAAPGVEWGYHPWVGTGGGFGEFGPLPGDDYWVALCTDFGRGYMWAGQPVDAGYATGKWSAGRSLTDGHTGRVVAEFLNALRSAIAGRAGGEAGPS